MVSTIINLMQQIQTAIEEAILSLYGVRLAAAVTRTDEQFGDYSTNVALQVMGALKEKPEGGPRAVAGQVAATVRETLAGVAKEVSVAGPGFINITVSDAALLDVAGSTPRQSYAGQTVVAEYSDPNPFKVLHAGHLYTSVVGDAIANLLASAGATVYRVNFGGDVGLHVGKTMWAIIKELGGEEPDKLAEIPEATRSEWLTQRYIEGNNAYEDEAPAKDEIMALNKKVYAIHSAGDHESAFARIYWMCRQWSYDYFDSFYARVGSHFDKYYPESTTAPLGLAKAKALLAEGILQESDGAVVFKGEDHGLHTRVFITSQGLPTYEAKDLGLILAKWDDYHFDKSVVITGNDIVEYMKVVLKVVEQFDAKLAQASTHLTHGIVKLQGGTKMSSRKGNILRAADILDEAAAANQQQNGQEDPRVMLGAVKYAFLKPRIGADIIYDPGESVSLQGNSGPYLQYAHARARSILRKAPQDRSATPAIEKDGLQPDERSLLRKLSEYPETVDKAVSELLPHHICTYLYELAQSFNRFYEKNRVLGDPREDVRLFLVEKYAGVLKQGLGILNIEAPDSM
jgi:arginyl-tRNA synthetase